MQTVDLFKEQLSNHNCVVGTLAQDEVSHLREPIDYDKNEIITFMCARQTKYKIHANVRPWLRWNRKWHVEASV